MYILYNHITSNQSVYRFQLLNRSDSTTEPIPTAGKTVTFEMYGTDPLTRVASLAASVECTITDEDTGEGEFTLGGDFVASPGIYRGYIRVLGGVEDNLVLPRVGNITVDIRSL